MCFSKAQENGDKEKTKRRERREAETPSVTSGAEAVNHLSCPGSSSFFR
jgi:hypothetical protein